MVHDVFVLGFGLVYSDNDERERLYLALIWFTRTMMSGNVCTWLWLVYSDNDERERLYLALAWFTQTMMSGNVCTDDLLKIFAISYVIKLMFSSLFGKIMISSSLDRSRLFVQSSDRELSQSMILGELSIWGTWLSWFTLHTRVRQNIKNLFLRQSNL